MALKGDFYINIYYVCMYQPTTLNRFAVSAACWGGIYIVESTCLNGIYTVESAI